MKTYVKLYNVMDTRNGQVYSEVVVDERKVHYFVPIVTE